MLGHRRDVLPNAKALFRTADYAAVRGLIVGSAALPSTSTIDAALFHIDTCAALLLNDRQPDNAPTAYDVWDPIADDVVYYRTYALWLRGDISLAHDVLRNHNPITKYYEIANTFLRGWLFAASGELTKQLAQTATALRGLLEDPERDPYLLSVVSLAAAALVREMPSVGAFHLLNDALPLLRADTDTYTILHVRRALAQIEALHGRYPTALRHLTFAGEFARDAIDRAFVHFDYALIASWAKQTTAGEAAFDVGVAALECADLEHRTDEGAFVLTIAAIAAAAIRPTVAQRYADWAEAVIPTISPRWGIGHGKRAAALLDEAVALTTSDLDLAVERGSRSGEVLESIGYFWRAGRLSAHLHSLTGHTAYRRRAERLLSSYHDGPLAMNDDPAHLPPRLREILELIVAGLTVEQIANALGIAEGTVRKHIQRLHKIYGVTNRAQLLAKIARMAREAGAAIAS